MIIVLLNSHYANLSGLTIFFINNYLINKGTFLYWYKHFFEAQNYFFAINVFEKKTEQFCKEVAA